MKINLDDLKSDVSKDFKNRVLSAALPELQKAKIENKQPSIFSRLEWLGLAFASVIAWTLGNSLLQQETNENDLLEFADQDIIDNLDLLTTLDEDDLELLLNAEENDV